MFIDSERIIKAIVKKRKRKSNILYHFTSLENAIKIFKMDTLFGETTHENHPKIKGELGTSITHNKDFKSQMISTDVRLTLDISNLKNKITPVVQTKDELEEYGDEEEEFVHGPIHNLHIYIKDIQIKNPYFNIHLVHPKELKKIDEYAKKYNIPKSISHQM